MPKRRDARYCCVACRVRAHRLAMTPAIRARERVKDAARHRSAYAARMNTRIEAEVPSDKVAMPGERQ